MLNLYLYLLGFLVFASVAVTNPLALLNTSHVAGDAADQPLVGSPDPRFSVEVHFAGPKLPLISCLMSTVDFLVVLGSQDFWGSTKGVSWKLANYPELGMFVSPRSEGGEIERRFVIWGLGQGIGQMIRLNRFQAATFALSWKGRKVGTIVLVDWPSGRTIQSTQDVTQQPKVSTVNSSSDLSTSPEGKSRTTQNIQNSELIVQIMLTETSIEPLDVFLLAITVIVQAAERGTARILRGYTSPAVSAGVRTPVHVVFEEPEPARTSSPFFDVEWLIVTMAKIPEYMITKGVFREAVLLVEVDGISVADGFLMQSIPGIGSNVSVS